MKTSNNLTLDMDGMEIICVMANGNPGALTVIMKMLSEGRAIDPYCEPMLPILYLDGKGIYGGEIWVLYKDVCGQKIENMLALLRHVQLGMSSEDDMFKPKEMDAVMKEVQERLPKFNRQGDQV